MLHLLGDYTEIIKIITLAPELDPTGETIKYLGDRQIIVSLGHSIANAEQTKSDRTGRNDGDSRF